MNQATVLSIPRNLSHFYRLVFQYPVSKNIFSYDDIRDRITDKNSRPPTTRIIRAGILDWKLSFLNRKSAFRDSGHGILWLHTSDLSKIWIRQQILKNINEACWPFFVPISVKFAYNKESIIVFYTNLHANFSVWKISRNSCSKIWES